MYIRAVSSNDPMSPRNSYTAQTLYSSRLWWLTLSFQKSVCANISISLCTPTLHTYFITIAPWECLRPDVHVWVFDSLLDGWFVLHMLLMLVPQSVCIDARDEKGWNDDVD